MSCKSLTDNHRNKTLGAMGIYFPWARHIYGSTTKNGFRRGGRIPPVSGMEEGDLCERGCPNVFSVAARCVRSGDRTQDSLAHFHGARRRDAIDGSPLVPYPLLRHASTYRTKTTTHLRTNIVRLMGAMVGLGGFSGFRFCITSCQLLPLPVTCWVK